MYEPYLRPEQVAEQIGGITPTYVRMACARRFGNVVKCIDVGSGKKHVYKIRLSEFQKWLEREEEGKIA